MPLADILEWTGCALSLTGAFLLSTHTKRSSYGWIFFLSANLVFIGFALNIERYGLLVQQLGFTATSLLGIYRSKLFVRQS